MNEYSTNQTQHFTGCASLAAIGVKLRQIKFFEPIRNIVQVKQKTIKYTPADKLYDAFIRRLSGAHGLVEINTRLRSDPALQQAFGRSACAEQSVVQETLNACTPENVLQLQRALDEIYRQQSQCVHHDYQANWQLTYCRYERIAMRPESCFCSASGYFAAQYHRRGRQVGRVLATHYEEVVVDRLFAGNVQLIKALQPLGAGG